MRRCYNVRTFENRLYLSIREDKRKMDDCSIVMMDVLKGA